MRHTIIAGATLALCVLAATPSTAVTIISSEGVESRYSRSDYVTEADGKPLPVIVRGVPFTGMTQSSFDAALINVLSATRQPQPATRFTVHPIGGDGGSPYRLVMVFGPSDGLAFETQCGAPDTARFGTMPAGQVKVSVALCRHGKVLSHAIASTMAADVDDPAFRMLFAELFLALFPIDSPYLGNGA